MDTMYLPALSPGHGRIAILGAGLMGRLLAVALAREGWSVQVHDAGGPEGEASAARVAAAMLAPLAEAAVSEPAVVRMGRYGMRRWPELLGDLGRPVFLQQNGTLIVWHWQDGAEAARLRDKLARTQALLPDLPAAQMLDAAGIARHEPALAGRFHAGLYLPGEGQLDNRQLLAALATRMQELGVATHWHSRKALADFAPGSPGQPDLLLDCRGLGARADWPALRGVRGEIVRVHAPEVTLARPTRLVHPRYAVYVVPRQEHVFVIGATEIESDDLSPASVQSVLELLSAAYALHSGFAQARILEVATQCRPALPDNNPALRMPAARTLQINGLYRHGYLIAPALLDVALQFIREGRSSLAAQFGLRLQMGPETSP